MNTIVLVFLSVSLFVGSGAEAVRISITPQKCIATLQNQVHVSCILDGDDRDMEVSFMEISRNNDEPIAFIRDCDNIPLPDHSTNGFQVNGHVDKDPKQSYLNLSLFHPESKDTGVYTCIVYYLDKTGHLKTETASGNLLVENIDLKSLEMILNEVKSKIVKLENKNNELQKQVTQLGERNKTLSEEVAVLHKKAVYTTAFTVTSWRQFTTSIGKIFILPDVIMKTGAGLDEAAGIFTAPIAGIYAFHVVVRSNNNCFLHLNFMKNNQRVFLSVTYDKDSWPQSSASTVVDLQPGDRIFLKMGDSGCKVHPNQTFFSGYLVQPS